MALNKKSGGRKKGTPNKNTKEIKEAINLIISNNIETLQTDIDSLEPKDRLQFIEKLLKYCIPVMQKNEMDINSEIQPTTIIFRDYENN
ncbi:MAG: hypothetical protein ACOYLE_02795 [Bacteroidales bacterium]